MPEAGHFPMMEDSDTFNRLLAEAVEGFKDRLTAPGGGGSTVGGDGELARGREAAGRLAWADAYTALSLADRSSSLAGEDLELLATAAYLLGRVEDCLQALQRAQRLHAEAGELRRGRAVRVLACLPPDQPGRARPGECGWHGPTACCWRTSRSAERGFVLVPVALGQAVAGDYAAAGRTAARAAAIGRRASDADLVALALSVHGRHGASGAVDEGLGLLDEAMVAVVSGELSAPVAGAVYCSVLDACQESLEWRRAQEGPPRWRPGATSSRTWSPSPASAWSTGRDPPAARGLAGGGRGGQTGR